MYDCLSNLRKRALELNQLSVKEHCVSDLHILPLLHVVLESSTFLPPPHGIVVRETALVATFGRCLTPKSEYKDTWIYSVQN